MNYFIVMLMAGFLTGGEMRLAAGIEVSIARFLTGGEVRSMISCLEALGADSSVAKGSCLMSIDSVASVGVLTLEDGA